MLGTGTSQLSNPTFLIMLVQQKVLEKFALLCSKIVKATLPLLLRDYKDDQNFTDVLFALKANPKITNVPTVDPESNTTIKKTGVYSFEDYWPKSL